MKKRLEKRVDEMTKYALSREMIKISQNTHFRRSKHYVKGAQWFVRVGEEHIYLKRRRHAERLIRTCIHNAMTIREICKAHDAVMLMKGSLPENNFSTFDARLFPFFRVEQALVAYSDGEWGRVFSMIKANFSLYHPYIIENGYLHEIPELSRIQEDHMVNLQELIKL